MTISGDIPFDGRDAREPRFGAVYVDISIPAGMGQTEINTKRMNPAAVDARLVLVALLEEMLHIKACFRT